MVINPKKSPTNLICQLQFKEFPQRLRFHRPLHHSLRSFQSKKPTFSSLLYKTKKHKASFRFEFHFWLHCPSLLTLLPDSSELPWLLSPDPMSLPSNPPPNSAVPLIVINSLISFGNGLRFAAESDRVRPGLASAASTAHRKARFLRLVKS